MIRLTIPGVPIPKGRPRATLRGRHAAVYTPKKTAKFERTVKLTAIAHGIRRPLEVPIRVEIDAYWPMLGQALKSSRRPRAPKATRPDADNVAKSVLDGLEGVAFKHDSTIVELVVRKWHAAQGEKPRTEVLIEEVQ